VTATGLSEREAAARLAARGGPGRPPSSRSYTSIVVANVFTLFNAILAAFGVLTLVFGDPRDALFLGIVVANAAIGIVEEVRAKRTLDRLNALIAPTATVVRDGATRSVPAAAAVPGDLVAVAPGDQIVADGTLADADGLRLDESILTGESEPVARADGEQVRSGAFVVEGAARYVVTAVGEDSYAQRITGQARAFRHPRSPLERALNRLLLALIAVMAPLAVVLGLSLALRSTPSGEAVPKATAAMVSLVPEGLILLASLTFAAAAVRMARRGALAQQLNAIESLAAADVICLDKTGTLTEPALRLAGLVPAAGVTPDELAAALGRYAATSPVRNLTVDALAAAWPRPAEAVVDQVPFASRRRWSAVQLADATLILGAPELLDDAGLRRAAAAQQDEGRRVVAIARTDRPLAGHDPESGLPPGARPLGIVALAERLRDDTKATVEFLRREGVELRILSGDAPATVGAIAADAGIAPPGAAIDGSRLPDDPEALRAVVAEAPVIGRISPQDKRRVVQALTAEGRYVAMIGDGVNDVPALKAARLAIAQGSGTQMARSVADVVLLSGDFSAMPRMVGEGRRILRNVQRVARLFVSKAAFAAFLILTVGTTSAAYPFLPRHLTIASTFGVGLPAMVLALAPSSGPWRSEHFLRDVARFAVPAGVAVGAGVLGAYLVALHVFDLPVTSARTVSTTVMLGGLLFILVELEARPTRRRHLVELLAAVMAAGYVIVLLIGPAREFFALAAPEPQLVAISAAGLAAAWALTAAGLRLTDRSTPTPPAWQRTR
jgi:P-type E1-E2 ATPase